MKEDGVEARLIRCGQIFTTELGDVCLKLAYALGAPQSAVAYETVRAADLGNGEICELPPTEMVVSGPKAFDLYRTNYLFAEIKIARDRWHGKAVERQIRINHLEAALAKAKETIKALHGSAGWDIYDRCSPEMKLINAALEDSN